MSASRLSAARGSERLRDRRRTRRHRILFALGALFALCLAGIIYELNQSAFRIAHVQVYGADQTYTDIATAAMQGSYLGLVPRDSTFFYPGAAIRTDIVARHPDIAAVALFRNGLTGLSIKVNDRVPVARWCGASYARAASSTAPCYLFDASGFVFATTSEQQLVNPFALYESLAVGVTDPMQTMLPNESKLPAIFDFARQLATLGATTESVVIRGDEVDDYLASGTRVTYVLGNEEAAFTALTSAHKDIDLASGTVDYVDLRFSGKVYIKKK